MKMGFKKLMEEGYRKSSKENAEVAKEMEKHLADIKCDSSSSFHPPENECVICFALEMGEVCLDRDKENYNVCEEHLKLTK